MPNQQHQITEGMCGCNTDENWMYDVGCVLCNAYKFVIRFLSFCSHIATQKFSSVIKSSVLCIIFCRFHIIANVIVLRGVIILYYMLYDAFFWWADKWWMLPKLKINIIIIIMQHLMRRVSVLRMTNRGHVVVYVEIICLWMKCQNTCSNIRGRQKCDEINLYFKVVELKENWPLCIVCRMQENGAADPTQGCGLGMTFHIN